MGLLGDNWDDPRTMATLQMAAGLLGGGNFGQAAGRGLSGYQQTMAAAQELEQRKKELAMREAQAAQMSQLHGLQLQEAQRAVQERKQLSELAARSARSPQQMAMGSTGPTNAAAAAIPATAPGFDWGQYATGVAAIDPMKALQIQTAMRKEQPKLSKLEPMRGPDGKMINVAVFEDGTSKILPYGVKPDVALQSMGDRVMAIDRNSTQGGESWRMGAAPDSASALGNLKLSQQKFDWEKTQAGKPQFHDGSWVSPPTAQNPAGTAVQVPGFSKPLTESQGNATAFSMRAKNALENLDKVDTVTNGDYYASRLPWGTGNFMMSSSGQAAMNSEKQFIAAMLRKDSGAAISHGEYKEAGDQLFPRPGDTIEQLEQKARNRDVVLASMGVQAGKSGTAQGAEAMKTLPDRSNKPKAIAPGSTIKFDANGIMVVDQ